MLSTVYPLQVGPLGYKHASFQGLLAPAPLLGHIQSTPQFLDPPSVLEHLSWHPCPTGCWDLHTEPQGWLHAMAKGMLFCLGEGLTAPPAGLGQG